MIPHSSTVSHQNTHHATHASTGAETDAQGTLAPDIVRTALTCGQKIQGRQKNTTRAQLAAATFKP